ncbi:glycosyltransferase family 4 protein [Acidocella sp.]|uniref:glycosyltransferase family 4 protein n=1 Tax=Acidocella sp. TaxID=50710 RepID=UPI0026094B6E|nr:glycosyltransferase family 4 protein [Acidocella sp.]
MIDRPRTILQVLPRLDAGGAERVAIEIAAAARRAGHRALIAAGPGRLAPLAARAGAEVIPLDLSQKNPLSIWRNTKKLTKLIKREQVDLIHAHSRAPAWAAHGAARRAGIPFVTTYHGVYGEATRLKKRYNHIMARGARVAAVSVFISDLIKTRYNIDPEIIRLIPNGVDTAIFDPAAVRGDRAARLARAWRIEEGQPTILLPARLTGWKGQRLFIRALARLRHQEAVGILIGGDQGRHAYTRELLALAAQLGVGGRLRIAGHVDDMPAALMLADVVVNCSTEPEAFGRTIIEAQAMARIVIAAGHGGAQETIEPGVSGFLIPPHDETALASALDAVLEAGAAPRVAFGQRARAAVAARFSLEAMQAGYLGLYGELLG